ncbi:MAG: hypothetical protein OXM55_04950, partial [Bdellovibrionales bacterium]|nr:hypothetical protein [Bdellovibrionales bacterium]
APSAPAQFYSDFKERGGWAALLSQPAKPPPPTLTWEELREAIREYNKKAPKGERIINYVTYRIDKLYKKIPGAPSVPAKFYSDFKERGGWPALLGKICQRVFTAQ